MGSDIHAFVEFRHAGMSGSRWLSFASEVFLERDYYLFERLAGARGELANAIVPPRGFPEDASSHALAENLLWIDYTGQESNPLVKTCTPKDAEEWVKSGKSKYFGTDTKMKLAVDLKGKKEPQLLNVSRPQQVSQPDWHSHSWLSAAEFETALLATQQPIPRTYAACLAAMHSLEENGCEVRVVFWFDN